MASCFVVVIKRRVRNLPLTISNVKESGAAQEKTGRSGLQPVKDIGRTKRPLREITERDSAFLTLSSRTVPDSGLADFCRFSRRNAQQRPELA
jgi:hypothetical protein